MLFNVLKISLSDDDPSHHLHVVVDLGQVMVIVLFDFDLVLDPVHGLDLDLDDVHGPDLVLDHDHRDDDDDHLLFLVDHHCVVLQDLENVDHVFVHRYSSLILHFVLVSFFLVERVAEVVTVMRMTMKMMKMKTVTTMIQSMTMRNLTTNLKNERDESKIHHQQVSIRFFVSFFFFLSVVLFFDDLLFGSSLF